MMLLGCRKAEKMKMISHSPTDFRTQATQVLNDSDRRYNPDFDAVDLDAFVILFVGSLSFIGRWRLRSESRSLVKSLNFSL